ncbi:hypothetical protein M9Y10_000730 [Tritrichomonas musculus]|uniref:Uncharacterized protein n=1 Tax=Tritrichomonas musculus TaxID=1915356 RepID=A0ABR2L5W6_9EUKA
MPIPRKPQNDFFLPQTSFYDVFNVENNNVLLNYYLDDNNQDDDNFDSSLFDTYIFSRVNFYYEYTYESNQTESYDEVFAQECSTDRYIFLDDLFCLLIINDILKKFEDDFKKNKFILEMFKKIQCTNSAKRIQRLKFLTNQNQQMLYLNRLKTRKWKPNIWLQRS